MSDQNLDRFWEACGATPPLRFVVQERDRSDADSVRSYARPFILIGRDPRTDLVLNHPQVSRRHAYIQVISGRPFCFDLDSRTAISWSGSLRRWGWMQPSRPIQLGQFQLSVPSEELPPTGPAIATARKHGGHMPDPLAAIPPDDDSAPRLVLERAEGPGGPIRWPIERVLTLVGRSPDCALKLSDLTVSRFHCALLLHEDELWVIDLLGREGTLVNGEVVRWARLERGDRLRIGRHHLVLRSMSGASLLKRTRGLRLPPDASASRSTTGRPGLRLVPAGPDSEFSAPLPPFRVPPVLLDPTSNPQVTATSLAPVPINYPAHTAHQSPVQVERLAAEVLPDSIRYAEALLAPLLNQMSVMQQQMFDQYHQSMMTMMHMFGKLHQDQQDLVDRELDEIRRLTREMREIQETLARGPAQASPTGPGLAPSPVPPSSPAPSFSPSPHSEARPVPEPRPVRAQAPEPAPADADYRQAHAILIQRMSNLQQERQSRWQSLLNRISGSRADNPT